jgi:allene oxide cyclase
VTRRIRAGRIDGFIQHEEKLVKHHSLLFACAALLLTGPVVLASEKIVLIEHPSNETTVHTAKAGTDAVGDILSFANPVFDAANKQQVASDQGFCVRTVVGKSWECMWTMLLKEGLITVEGPFHDTGDSIFAITGGTGKYEGAKGHMKLHPREGHPEAYDFIYELL